MLASALSGLAFYLYPNTSIFGHIVITTIEIFWKLHKDTLKRLLPWLPIDVVSMNIVTFPIVFGIMNHVRAFTPWLAPSMLKKIMSLSTNYKYVILGYEFHFEPNDHPVYLQRRRHLHQIPQGTFWTRTTIHTLIKLIKIFNSI